MSSGVQAWRSTEKLRVRVLGIVFFVICALFLWTTIAIYNKQFVKTVDVNLITDSVGNALPATRTSRFAASPSARCGRAGPRVAR
jgi:phospholipid/cholesterol/gamma-HCH transport system substrate-binding protein